MEVAWQISCVMIEQATKVEEGGYLYLPSKLSRCSFRGAGYSGLSKGRIIRPPPRIIRPSGQNRDFIRPNVRPYARLVFLPVLSQIRGGRIFPKYPARIFRPWYNTGTISGQKSGPYTALLFLRRLSQNQGAGYFNNIRPGLSGLATFFLLTFDRPTKSNTHKYETM